MRRLALLGFLLLAPALGAQASRGPLGVAIGTRLRLQTVTRESDVVGTLVATLGDTLVLQTRDASAAAGATDLRVEQVALPADQIQRAFVSAGRESRATSGARGAAYGAVFAVGLTVVGRAFGKLADDGASSDSDPDADWSDRPSFVRALGTVAAVTVPFGAVVGAFRPHTRWAELPLRSR